MKFGDIIPVIFKKLIHEEMKRPLTNIEIMEVIVDIYLRNENFVKVNGRYQLSMNDTIYTFQAEFLNDKTVIFHRFRNHDSEAGCWSKVVGHPFYYTLKSFTSFDEKVGNNLRKELRRLDAALCRAWKYLHLDESPSESEFSDEFEFIDEDSE